MWSAARYCPLVSFWILAGGERISGDCPLVLVNLGAGVVVCNYVAKIPSRTDWSLGGLF